MVIRLSKTNKIQSSKPCHHCIQHMYTISQQKGYNLKHIYYSDESSNLIKTNILALKNDKQHYSKGNK